MKRTRIIATIGPACDDRETLKALLEAGVDVCRLNYSHGEPEEKQTSTVAFETSKTNLDAPLASWPTFLAPNFDSANFPRFTCSLKARRLCCTAVCGK